MTGSAGASWPRLTSSASRAARGSSSPERWSGRARRRSSSSSRPRRPRSSGSSGCCASRRTSGSARDRRSRSSSGRRPRRASGRSSSPWAGSPARGSPSRRSAGSRRDVGSMEKQMETSAADELAALRRRVKEARRGRRRQGRETAAVAQGRPPGSEHDPMWRTAVVVVERGEKGDVEGGRAPEGRVRVERDVMWFRAPKPEPGERAVFLLHRRELDGAGTSRCSAHRRAARHAARGASWTRSESVISPKADCGRGGESVPLVVVNMIPNNRSGESQPGQRAEHHRRPARSAADRGLGVHAEPRGEPERADLRLDERRAHLGARVDRPELGLAVGTGDITIRFAASGTPLRRDPAPALGRAAAEHPAHAQLHRGAAMTVLVDRSRRRTARPALGEAMTALGGSGAGRDHVYVGSNDALRPAPAASPRPSTLARRRRRDASAAERLHDQPASRRARRLFGRRGAGRAADPPGGASRRHGLRRLLRAALDQRHEHARLRHRRRPRRQLGGAARRRSRPRRTGRRRSRAGASRTGVNVPWFTFIGQQRLLPNLAHRGRPAEQLDTSTSRGPT